MSEENVTNTTKENAHLANAKKEFYGFINDSSEVISQVVSGLVFTLYMLAVLKISNYFKSNALVFLSTLSEFYYLTNGEIINDDLSGDNFDENNKYGENHE